MQDATAAQVAVPVLHVDWLYLYCMLASDAGVFSVPEERIASRRRYPTQHTHSCIVIALYNRLYGHLRHVRKKERVRVELISFGSTRGLHVVASW